MKTRKLGWTDLELSIVGFGAWALGGGDYAFGWGPQDDKLSIRAIDESLDMGVNWIDTAPIYGLGRSEEVIGHALKGKRDKVIIATKCCMVWDADREIGHSLKAESIRAEVEASLKRLNTDYIDLYQIHWPNPDPDIEEGWTEIGEFIKEGKIRYAGVSNFNPAQIGRAGAIHPVASLQPFYNMFGRGIEEQTLPYCRDNEIGVVAYSPLQNGLLTGKFSKDRVAALDPSDFRKEKGGAFQEPIFSINLEIVAELQKLAQMHDKTMAQLALSWVLRRSEVTSAITGTRKPGQILETAEAANWSLDESTISEIEQILGRRDEMLASLTAGLADVK